MIFPVTVLLLICSNLIRPKKNEALCRPADVAGFWIAPSRAIQTQVLITG
jgi:hypothetical protein